MRFWIQDLAYKLINWLLKQYVAQLCAELGDALGVPVKRNGLNGVVEFEGRQLKFSVTHDVIKKVVIRYWVFGVNPRMGRLEPENLTDGVESLLSVMGVVRE